MRNRLENKINKGEKLNRQEKEIKRKQDEGNFGDLYIPPVRITESQAGEYNEYSRLDVDGNQVRSYTGMAILNPPIEFEEGTYNLVGMNDGVVEVAISSLDGSIYAGEGSVTLDSSGLTLTLQTDSADTGSQIKWSDGTHTPSNMIAIHQGSPVNVTQTIITTQPAISGENTITEIQSMDSLSGSYISYLELAIQASVGSWATIGANHIELQGIDTNVYSTIYFDKNTSYKTSNTLTGTETAGTVKWDSSRDALTVIETGLTNHIGQELYFYCINQTGATITKGTAVMFAGSLGASGILKITPAVANGSYSSIYIMGIAAQDFTNGSTGKVIFFGELSGVNTNAYAAGTILYLDPSVPGGLTSTAPSAPNLKYAIAATVDQKSNGHIFVRAIYGQNLSELNDVQITSAVSGNVIKYDGTKWVNGTIDTTPNARYLSPISCDLFDVDTASLTPFVIRANSSGTLVKKAGESNHPGIITIGNANSNNSGSSLGISNSGASLNSIVLSNVEAFEIILRPLSVSNATYRIGWMDSFGSSVPTNGLFLNASANGTTLDLGIYPLNGGSGSVTNFTTLSNNTWYRLKMTNGGTGAVNAYVYNTSGTLLASSTYTGTVTSNAVTWVAFAFRPTATGASNIVDIDKIDLYSTATYTR